MKEKVRVALAQIAIESLDSARNLERIAHWCREAAREPVDLVVFPELANIGQVPGRSREFGAQYLAAADPVPGPFTDGLGELARRYGFYIVAGMAERHPQIPYTVFNSAVLVAPTGQVVGVQRKLHLPGEECHYFATGDEVRVFPTDLGILSLQICYDVYFPEVARAAALQGAEILCGLFNLTHRPEWPGRLVHLAVVRAYENMQHVVCVNRVGENHGKTYGGESVAAVPPGRIVAEAPPAQEALVYATLTDAAIAEERAFRPVFADLRPGAYGEPWRRLVGMGSIQ